MKLFYHLGNPERGWNDPPVLLHTGSSAPPQVSQQGQKRTLLNKRVAFPVLGAGTTGSSLPQSNLSTSGAPPPLAAGSPPLATGALGTEKELDLLFACKLGFMYIKYLGLGGSSILSCTNS